MNALMHAKNQGEILTGLIYMNQDSHDLHAIVQTVDQPLNQLKEEDLCPGRKALIDINADLR
jgi:2-oxoglutarate ferredoxin oxidoreductase subunit beta